MWRILILGLLILSILPPIPAHSQSEAPSFIAHYDGIIQQDEILGFRIEVEEGDTLQVLSLGFNDEQQFRFALTGEPLPELSQQLLLAEDFDSEAVKTSLDVQTLQWGKGVQEESQGMAYTIHVIHSVTSDDPLYFYFVLGTAIETSPYQIKFARNVDPNRVSETLYTTPRSIIETWDDINVEVSAETTDFVTFEGRLKGNHSSFKSYIEPDGVDFYEILDVKAGQNLYVLLRGESTPYTGLQFNLIDKSRLADGQRPADYERLRQEAINAYGAEKYQQEQSAIFEAFEPDMNEQIKALDEAAKIPPSPFMSSGGYALYGKFLWFPVREDGDYGIIVERDPTLENSPLYSYDYELAVAINPNYFTQLSALRKAAHVGNMDPDPTLPLTRRILDVYTQSIRGQLSDVTGAVEFDLTPVSIYEEVEARFTLISDFPEPKHAIYAESPTATFTETWEEWRDFTTQRQLLFDPSTVVGIGMDIGSADHNVTPRLHVYLPTESELSFKDLEFVLEVAVVPKNVHTQSLFFEEIPPYLSYFAPYELYPNLGGGEPVPVNRITLTDREIVVPPTNINVGLEILQFISVDQKIETFTVVALLRADWVDRKLANDAVLLKPLVGTYSGDKVDALVRGNNGFTMPEFNIQNQQSRRATQSRRITILGNGSVRYEERFSVTVQAPAFDFRDFPFDEQVFWIWLEPIEARQRYTFSAAERYNFGLEEAHGEEAWDFTLMKHEARYRDNFAQFNYELEAKRKLNYYVFRIFVPLFILVMLGWVIFFLKDYDKRVTAFGTNILLFITFNFTIGNDLPRLGYLTYMDAVLLTCFLLTATSFALSIYMRRISSTREAFVHQIDRVLMVGYPIVFMLSFVVLGMIFGVRI